MNNARVRTGASTASTNCPVSVNGATPTVQAKKPKRKLLEVGSMVKSTSCKYQILGVLGSGGFGDVYKVKKENDSTEFAMKTEDCGVDERLRRLKIEAEVLSACSKAKNATHFITLTDKGRTKEFKFIVMPIVWLTLDKIRLDIIKKQFSLPSAHKICVQLIESVRDLHAMGYLHRDLKPANFAAGLTEENRHMVYMLDFGVCRKFLDSKGNVINPRAKVAFMGTPRFAPRCAFRLQEQSRKDDLESLCYLMTDIFNDAVLPWRGMRDRVQLIQLKDNYMLRRGPIVADLFRRLPDCLEKIVKYVETLKYQEAPDYELLINEMRKYEDEVLDWCKPGVAPPAPKAVQPVQEAPVATTPQQQPQRKQEVSVNLEPPPSSKSQRSGRTSSSNNTSTTQQ